MSFVNVKKFIVFEAVFVLLFVFLAGLFLDPPSFLKEGLSPTFWYIVGIGIISFLLFAPISYVISLELNNEEKKRKFRRTWLGYACACGLLFLGMLIFGQIEGDTGGYALLAVILGIMISVPVLAFFALILFIEYKFGESTAFMRSRLVLVALLFLLVLSQQFGFFSPAGIPIL